MLPPAQPAAPWARLAASARRVLAASRSRLARAALWAGWTVLAAGVGFAVILGITRWWLLPQAADYRERIAAAVSGAVGQRVSIAAVHGEWQGLRPRLALRDLRIHDREGRVALLLEEVRGVVGWSSLWRAEIRFHSVEIVAPRVTVRRDAQGALHVAGIALAQAKGERGFSDWLLRQGRIRVRDAEITWLDEKRAAPPLRLASVNFQLENRWSRHRFGLRAAAPAALAGALDLRGDLRGEAIADWPDWRGQLFLQLDYADLAAWRAWLPLPVALDRGTGALRVWLGFEGPVLTELTADVRLRDVRSRLDKSLPQLDLLALAGRLGWKTLPRGFEFSAEKLALATRGGQTLQPTDFLLRMQDAADGRPASGELRANGLSLQPLVAFSAHLPLDAEVRARLRELAPRGTVHDLVVKWNGTWPRPQGYAAKGRFVNLGLNRFGAVPGFSGLSGFIDGNERGGSFSLASRNAVVELPRAFRDPLLFETLTAQAGWTRKGRDFELKLSNVAFANADLAGTLYGSYRGGPDTSGTVDFTGNLSRADARVVGRYIPLVVAADARAWLDTAFLSGSSNDVRLRLKGNLDHFPFADGKQGVFQVTAHPRDGTLDYAKGWPRIDNVAGELNFRGARMEAYVPQATILGARIANVRAVIPDLTAAETVLEVTGEAEGPTAEFFRFIEASPVNGYIDRFTEGMQATGPGKLQLRLDIPLPRPEATRVAGTYRFLNNRIEPHPDLPNLEQVNGVLEITESTLAAQKASAVVLGGPAAIVVVTQPDGRVRVAWSGRMNAGNLRKTSKHPLAEHVRGSAEWRGALTFGKGQTDALVESSLVGLALDLPAPLAKTASEPMPFRLERKATPPEQDTVLFSIGKVVSAHLRRRQAGDRMELERGAVSFGATPLMPDRPGLWIHGAAPALDLDGWRALWAAGPAGAPAAVAGMDQRLGMLDAFGKRFHELHLVAGEKAGAWQARVAGREVNGELQWRGEGAGRLSGRLAHLMVPPDTPRPLRAPAEGPVVERELPALDVVVENFGLRERQLGRLELGAEPAGGVWRIERLKLTNPEGQLAATGQWQGGATQPRTHLKLTLDATDIGKLLTRLGFANTVQRGNGKLEGNLSWSGPPYAIDYPTLTGNLALEAYSGQFLKIEPGVGKLLGILSLQALPRRLLFDFRDVFSAGFEFDSVAGAATIAKGVATTQDFRISGSAAKVSMSGEVDLAAETQRLRIRVVPALGEGVSLAGSLLGGPLVGAATFLVHKALKDPIDQLAAAEYNVTGTWTEPVVAKAEAPSLPPAAGN